MNRLKQTFIVLILGLSLSLTAHGVRGDEVSIALEGNKVVKVRKRSSALSKATGFLAKTIADLQETISYSHSLGNKFNVRLSNSRVLFPVGNGDIIVTDTTNLDFNFLSSNFQNTLDHFDVKLNVRANVKPSLRRFFISSATATAKKREYLNAPGPQGTTTEIGIDDQLFEIGSGIKVDHNRYARYNEWLGRFTKNAKDFPINAKKADQMLIGEGYSYAFEGGVALGPSAVIAGGTKIPLSANLSFSKNLKAGRFEMIIYKNSETEILFSLRQVKQPANKDDFTFSYGGSIKASPNLIIGSNSNSIFKLPTTFTIFEVQRSKTHKTEELFNSVYQIDLTNTANRVAYNEAMSGFDFSLFNVLSIIKRITKRSDRILKKFRNSNVQLVLESSAVEVTNAKAFSTNLLNVSKRRTTRKHVINTGEIQFYDRKVKNIQGSLEKSKIVKNLLTGSKIDSFEIIAYEEFGKQANPKPDDVVILARKIIFDERTRRQKFIQYVKSLKPFLSSNTILVNKNTKLPQNLNTTQGRMDFFITRRDIFSLRRLNLQEAHSIIAKSFGTHLGRLGNFRNDKKIALFATQNPKNWKAGFFKNILARNKIKSIKNFALEFSKLQKALRINDQVESATEASNVLRRMLSNPYHADLYASLFKDLLVRVGRKPLINISLYNQKAGVHYESKKFTERAFIRDGLVLNNRLENTLNGEGFYDDLSDLYDRSPYINRKGIVIFDFNEKFNGFIKISFKEKNGSTYQNAGEIIIDAEKLNSPYFRFNLRNGKSQAEIYAKELLKDASGDVQSFFSLSYDGKVYSEDIRLR